MLNAFLAFVIVTLLRYQCQCFVRTGLYKHVQGNAAVGSMRCAASLYTTARGAEFDTAGDICGVLNTPWFQTPILQPGRNYYKLVELTQFKQTKVVNTPVPDNFYLGDSIILYLEKEANVGGTVKFSLDIFDGNANVGGFGVTDHIYSHIDTTKYSGIINFSSFVNGYWTSEQHISDPFTSGTGKLELVVTSSTFQIYVDDVNVHNYAAHLPVPRNLIVLYQGVDTTCTKLKFSYKKFTTKYINTPVPNIFQLGDSIVLYLEKEANVAGTLKFNVDIFDGNANVGGFGVTDHIYSHIDTTKYSGIINFSSFVNGYWTSEQHISDPFTNGPGKLELVVTESTFLVYVDDVNIHNYTTHLPVPSNLIVLYQGVDTVCSGLQFFDRN